MMISIWFTKFAKCWNQMIHVSLGSGRKLQTLVRKTWKQTKKTEKINNLPTLVKIETDNKTLNKCDNGKRERAFKNWHEQVAQAHFKAGLRWQAEPTLTQPPTMRMRVRKRLLRAPGKNHRSSFLLSDGQGFLCILSTRDFCSLG